MGSLQLLLTVTGFVLLMIGMLAFMANMVRTGDLPHEWTRPSRLGVIGFFVFATSWLWALTTSWSIWRELKRTNPR